MKFTHQIEQFYYQFTLVEGGVYLLWIAAMRMLILVNQFLRLIRVEQTLAYA